MTSLFFGCSSQVAIHPPTRIPLLGLNSKQTDKIEQRFRQRTHAQHNIRLTATLWDSTLLDVEAARLQQGLAQQRTISETEIREQLEGWRHQYLSNQTSFTVLLELRNRPENDDLQSDVLIDPKRWSFSLSVDHRSSIGPEKVIVQTVDRYPNRSKGWHWRIALSVHFPGELYKKIQSRNTALPLTLRVKLPSSLAPAPFLTLDLPKSEIPLHWTILPPNTHSTPQSFARQSPEK